MQVLPDAFERNQANFQIVVVLQIILLDILKVFVGIYLKLATGCLVGHDDGMGVHLETADGPHVVDAFLYTMLEGAGFVVAVDHDHDLLGVHDCSNAYGQSGLGNKVHVVVEETAVGNDGVGGQAGSGLVEGDVAIGTYAAHEEVDASCFSDGFLVVCALCLEVCGVAVEDMDVFFLDVDMAEEVVPHEGVVALGMVLEEVDILVHVERDDVLEGYLSGFVEGDQFAVHA